jgi:hypothetical protein
VRGISRGRGFVQRKELPDRTPQAIRERTEITDIKFVHQTGLLAIFETRDSALKYGRVAARS